MPRVPARLLAASPALATGALLAAFLVPGADRVVRLPSVERRDLATVEADLYARPGERRPGVVLVLGALREGRRYPLLERLARSLAGCGYAVLVPELGRLRRLELGDDAVDDLVESVIALGAQPEVRGERVGVFGFSLGASLGLVAAADPRLEGRVAFVAGLGGYFRLADMLVAATADESLQPPSRFAVAASLVAALPGAERAPLERALAGDPDHPIQALRALDQAGLGPRALALLRLLGNTDPAAVGGLLAGLPGATDALTRLSPEAVLDRLRVPVWILHDRRDGFVPVGQALAMRAAVAGRPGFTFLVTDLLEHTEPASPGRHPGRILTAYLPGLVRLARFVHGPLAALQHATRP